MRTRTGLALLLAALGAKAGDLSDIVDKLVPKKETVSIKPVVDEDIKVEDYKITSYFGGTVDIRAKLTHEGKELKVEVTRIPSQNQGDYIHFKFQEGDIVWNYTGREGAKTEEGEPDDFLTSFDVEFPDGHTFHTHYAKDEYKYIRTWLDRIEKLLHVRSYQNRAVQDIGGLVGAIPAEFNKADYKPGGIDKETDDSSRKWLHLYKVDGNHPLRSVALRKSEEGTFTSATYRFTDNKGKWRYLILNMSDSKGDGTVDFANIWFEQVGFSIFKDGDSPVRVSGDIHSGAVGNPQELLNVIQGHHIHFWKQYGADLEKSEN